MASKKDLVEAYAYNRRRLVTAFVSGAPGGREVEPNRPGGPIVAGVVVGALVIGAGALTGAVKPTVEDGWDDNKVVVARDTGARYLAQNGVAYPVRNTASARLVIPPEDFEVVFAPEDKIAELRAGPTIGIEGAPDAVPRAEDLIQSGWTGCAIARTTKADGGVTPAGWSLQISETPAATAVPGDALVVRSIADGKQFLIAGSAAGHRRFPVSQQARAALGLTAAPLDMPAQWLNLFNVGSDLKALPGPAGRAALPASAKLPAGTVDGDLLLVKDRPERYLATAEGAFPLTEVQYRLYQLANPAKPVVLPVAPAKLAENLPTVLASTADWPRDLPAPYALDNTAACVIMSATPRGGPVTQLAEPIPNVYLTPQPNGVIEVDAAHGALVRSGTDSPVVLVDSVGKAYPLGNRGEQTRLGYGGVRPTFVLPGWIDALADGVVLDVGVIEKQAAAPADPAKSAATTRTATTPAGRRAGRRR
ncbi:type VII secretion protein EccB [Sporichthya polymorpha]|uniref:type VII secretion protein EccB n=1 Tax=Sporichthya polymorpha TaxID=35751 RepID=UPI00036D5E03|nr:type VII secretion protein EccB [Sporichthya polymorpha]